MPGTPVVFCSVHSNITCTLLPFLAITLHRFTNRTAKVITLDNICKDIFRFKNLFYSNQIYKNCITILLSNFYICFGVAKFDCFIIFMKEI